MPIQADVQVGISKETVFGTVVAPATFYEVTEEDLTHTITTAQGAGLRVGNRTGRADRRVVVKTEPTGSFTVEAITKSLGKLFEAAMTQAGTSTLISGTAYQQKFDVTQTDLLNSYTIQKGIPPVGGGTALPHTFNGMVCSGFEFSAGSEIPTHSFSFVGKGFDTATALATASYPASTSAFSFIHASLTIGGTPTAPTTTALATGGTAALNVRDFSLSFDNNLDSNGFNFGSTGGRTRKPAVGLRNITGSLTAEFDAVTLRDIYLNQTDTAITFTLQQSAATGGTAISGAVFPAIQFYIPVARFEGELPKANAGDVITQSIDFTVLDNGTTSPLTVCIVTADTAI